MIAKPALFSIDFLILAMVFFSYMVTFLYNIYIESSLKKKKETKHGYEDRWWTFADLENLLALSLVPNYFLSHCFLCLLLQMSLCFGIVNILI